MRRKQHEKTLWVARFLVMMCLCCAIVSTAFAELTFNVYELVCWKAEVNPISGLLAIDRDNKYLITSPDGRTVLSNPYEYIDLQDGFFVVREKGGQNCKGLLDENGKVLIPPQYAWIVTISDRWNAGIVSKPGTSDQYDFYGKDNALLLIDHVDLYYRGSLCGTLDRMDWDLSAMAYGDYLRVKNREGRYRWYNKEMKKTPVEDCGFDEFWIDYSTGEVIHQGTGQKAFVAGSTLHNDEVDSTLYYRDGILVDLQGNMVCSPQGCEPVFPFNKGSLVKVRNSSGLYGCIDLTGKQVVPCQYESLDDDIESAESCGYIYAERDGKSGYVNIRTGEEIGFKYPSTKCNQYSGFFTVTDLDGTLIVTCAGAGELPEHYDEIYAFSVFQERVKPSNPLAILTDADGKCGVIDMHGNWIMIPDDSYGDFSDLYPMNYDGTVFVSEIDNSNERKILSYVLSGKQEQTGSNGSKSTETSQETAAVQKDTSGTETGTQPGTQSDSWTCENGHEGNTGKFCTECGAPKPASAPADTDEPWTCENGHEGNTGKFCTECGVPKPVAPDTPWTCSNGHEGNTGKFCTECGVPRSK